MQDKTETIPTNYYNLDAIFSVGYRVNSIQRAIVQALLALRKEMCFLSKVMDISAIPEKERQHYYQLVLDQADCMQRSLEESAQKDRSGKLASIVRNNKVNAF